MMLFLFLFMSLSHVAHAQNNSDLFTSDRSNKALSHSIKPQSDEQLDQLTLGRSFFTIPWVQAPAATTARDGLGPLFNANSCVSCHKHNGGGDSSTLNIKEVSRSILFKLQQTNNHQPDPVYGDQLAINGQHDVPFEGHVKASVTTKTIQYKDTTNVILKRPIFVATHLNYGPLAEHTELNARRALSLVGLGLIEQIPKQQILNHQDPNDLNKDGISGKANWVWSESKQKIGFGLFGWKATTASLIDQTGKALNNDMGLTSPLFPHKNCTQYQKQCKHAYKSSEFDVPMLRLKAITTYISSLKAPRTHKDKNGEALFNKLGCSACHQKQYTTKKGIKINPYSDFLLHDMGDDLADNSFFYKATPNEWRTPPLWGIGLAKTLNPKAGFLHDGRASSIEEAILWHGGEAQRAKQNFIDLSTKDRTILLSFLTQQ